MSLGINTNIASLSAQRALSNTQADAATAMQRLSTGLRINSAKDDAAGLAISNSMTSRVNGLIRLPVVMQTMRYQCCRRLRVVFSQLQITCSVSVSSPFRHRVTTWVPQNADISTPRCLSSFLKLTESRTSTFNGQAQLNGTAVCQTVYSLSKLVRATTQLTTTLASHCRITTPPDGCQPGLPRFTVQLNGSILVLLVI